MNTVNQHIQKCLEKGYEGVHIINVSVSVSNNLRFVRKQLFLTIDNQLVNVKT